MILKKLESLFEFSSIIILAVTINILTNKLESRNLQFAVIINSFLLIAAATLGFFFAKEINYRVLLAEEQYRNSDKDYEDCIVDKFQNSNITALFIFFILLLIAGSYFLINRYLG
jgi:hypothetical protein